MKIFAFILILLSGPPGWADKGAVEIWGSGHGTWVGSELHLLDLVESGGLIDSEWVRHDWAWMPSLQSQLQLAKKMESIFYPELINQLSHKLYEIWALDPLLTEALLKAIKVYHWTLVQNPLVAKPVENPVVQKELFQVALRAGRSISINKTAWEHMPSTHRVALILHEALSSLNEGRCTDLRSRQIIGFLFSPQMRAVDSTYFQEFMGDCFPTQSNLMKRFLQEMGASEAFIPAGVFQPARFEIALFPRLGLENSRHQKEVTRGFYLRSDLEQLFDACQWNPGEVLPVGRYQMGLRASFLNVRFSTLKDEGENLPHLIWEIVTRAEVVLPVEVVKGQSCWSPSSDESLRYLKNFYQHRIF